MDPATLTLAMDQLGWGAYVPLVLALIGLFSIISTVYPASAPGAAIVHRLALLIGNARPATAAATAAPPAARLLPLLATLGLALALSACSATPGTNSNGTATTDAQQAVGVLYGGYDAAVAAELAYVTAAAPSPATVQAIEGYRTAAYADLHALMLAANSGSDTTALAAAAQLSLSALTTYLTNAGLMGAT
jgi:hypothetical protein